MVCLATAHPAKFPDAVEAAVGVRPALPEHLADLFDRPERYDELPDDVAAVAAYVAPRSAPERAAGPSRSRPSPVGRARLPVLRAQAERRSAR